MSTDAAQTLIRELKACQQADGLSDTALAARLGISLTMLSLVYSGKYVPGMKMIRGIMREFPGLGPHVSLFLQSGDRILNAS